MCYQNKKNMISNFANAKTPLTGLEWKKKSEIKRVEVLNLELKKNNLYEGFEIIKAPENGQIVLKIEKVIPANERGLVLLELEEKLKLAIDNGITVWCEPVGDKSKLRKLRGIEINAKETK
jgi:Tfp pilus assembly protein PilZ